MNSSSLDGTSNTRIEEEEEEEGLEIDLKWPWAIWSSNLPRTHESLPGHQSYANLDDW